MDVNRESEAASVAHVQGYLPDEVFRTICVAVWPHIAALLPIERLLESAN